jgi:acyl carrier protein phosphodiesterase
MNYLAHAYLSFNNPEILVGNMISDFVKGKKKFDYAPGIQKGIALHRAIDEFTDFHPVTKDAKKIFSQDYGLYSGAFMDVAYDYFLARDKAQFEPVSLLAFSQQVYGILEDYFLVLPPAFQAIFPYMKKHDWLFNYQHLSGIEKSFEGLARRATYIKESDTAFKIFTSNLEQLETRYHLFFPALKQFAINSLREKYL